MSLIIDRTAAQFIFERVELDIRTSIRLHDYARAGNYSGSLMVWRRIERDSALNFPEDNFCINELTELHPWFLLEALLK